MLQQTESTEASAVVRMAVLEADSVEDSLEAVHLTETEALEMASRVETSKVECRAEIRATDIQTVPAV